jgi:DNA polymerase III epsilon subunit-like protein
VVPGDKTGGNVKEILIADIETTGFLNQGGSIVEVGIVSLDLDSGQVKTVFDSVCREPILTAKHRNEPFGWIFKNSSLTVEEVKAAPAMEKLFSQIQDILNSYPLGVTAYNKKFDFSFLKDRGFKIRKELPCPMLLATDVCKIPGKRGGYKWPKVEEAWKHFFPSVPYIEQHRGADDAKHEAAIVYELYKMGVFKIDEKPPVWAV